jgi:formate C-acetyltransferase
MTDNVKKQLEYLRGRQYRALRADGEMDFSGILKGKSGYEASTAILREMLLAEMPRTFEGDRIGFHRHCHAPFRLDETGQKVLLSEFGNITINYAGAISKGMDAILKEIHAARAALSPDRGPFLDAAEEAVMAGLSYADRTAREAAESGNCALAAILAQIPHGPARNLNEALSFMKFIIFVLRCNGNTHLTLGRFDQYLFPYYLADRERGVTQAETLALIEEFFISLNFDTDLYFGVQQGETARVWSLAAVTNRGRTHGMRCRSCVSVPPWS